MLESGLYLERSRSCWESQKKGMKYYVHCQEVNNIFLCRLSHWQEWHELYHVSHGCKMMKIVSLKRKGKVLTIQSQKLLRIFWGRFHQIVFSRMIYEEWDVGLIPCWFVKITWIFSDKGWASGSYMLMVKSLQCVKFQKKHVFWWKFCPIIYTVE